MLESLGEIIFLAHNETTLYFNSGNEKLNTTLLNFKEGAIKALVKMHIYSEWAFIKPIKDSKESEIWKQRFDELVKSLISHLIDGMLEVTRNKEFYDIIKKVQLQNLLMWICQFLCWVIKFACFISVFAQKKFDILFDICFSFIRTFENEKKEMLDNPSEFVRESLDAVDR